MPLVRSAAVRYPSAPDTVILKIESQTKTSLAATANKENQ